MLFLTSATLILTGNLVYSTTTPGLLPCSPSENRSTNCSVGGVNDFFSVRDTKIYFEKRSSANEENTAGTIINVSRSLFGVYFQPYVFKEYYTDDYREEDVISLLRVVQTRFSKLVMYPVKEGSILFQHSFIHTPTAAAKINRMTDKEKYPGDLLQVFVLFSLQPPKSLLQRSPLKVLATTPFDDAVDMANRANEIFPETVKYLLLDVTSNSLSPSNLNLMGEQLRYSERRLKTSVKARLQGYGLGAVISASRCEDNAGDLLFDAGLSTEGTMEPSVLVTSLSFLKLVVLFYKTSRNEVQAGVDKTFRHITEEFELCRQKLNRVNPTIEFALASRWYTDTTEDGGNSNSKNLTEFWKKMNDFARKSNTTVFMEQAFDQPKSVFLRRSGWWKLEKNVTSLEYPNKTDYFVVEKIYEDWGQTDADKHRMGWRLEGDTTKKKVSHRTRDTVLIAGAAFVAGAVCLAGGLFLMYKKRRHWIIAKESGLSEQEVGEFFKGRSRKAIVREISENPEDLTDLEITTTLHCHAYDVALEIQKDQFSIEESSILGSGAFGLVCMGKIWKDGSTLNVAVKAVNSTSTEATSSLISRRSLLSEIKVMSFLGRHENLVSLLGAYTSDIRKGVLYAFLELCSLGSLEKYLRLQVKQQRLPEYLEIGPDSTETGSVNQDPRRTFALLCKWSIDIVQGMEYLASKHVVHADLACRNVLLDKQMRAKISDFGLSKRMYNYQGYVRSQQEPLPWRWMSPETLRQLVFSEKTDVWSFGVTLWEIYSLGDVPYPGLCWDQEFSSRLENGLRLVMPPALCPELQGDTDRVYHSVMLSCWNIDPGKRPTFAELSVVLRKLKKQS